MKNTVNMITVNPMRPKVFINIAAATISGPKKGLIQFLRKGGTEVCDPVIVGYRVNGANKRAGISCEVPEVLQEYLFQRMTYDPFMIPQALRIIKKHKLNILQSHGYKSNLLCMIIKRLTGLPWIAFVHGWTSENLKMNCYTAMDKIVLGFADKVVLVSRSMMNKLNLNWVHPDKILYIPNAVDPEELLASPDRENIRQKHAIDPEIPLIGVIGRLSPEKGHIYMINALPEIHKNIPLLKVIFVGDGQEKEKLLKKITELGLDNSVVFAGYQNNPALFYREMDLLAIPSLSEGMPNVALEAMLFGKPVVATRVGGVPEVVVDGITGRIVDSRSSDQLAMAVVDMFQKPELLTIYGIAGRQRVQKDFDPVQRVTRIAALYDEILQ